MKPYGRSIRKALISLFPNIGLDLSKFCMFTLFYLINLLTNLFYFYFSGCSQIAMKKWRIGGGSSRNMQRDMDLMPMYPTIGTNFLSRSFWVKRYLSLLFFSLLPSLTSFLLLSMFLFNNRELNRLFATTATVWSKLLCLSFLILAWISSNFDQVTLLLLFSFFTCFFFFSC